MDHRDIDAITDRADYQLVRDVVIDQYEQAVHDSKDTDTWGAVASHLYRAARLADALHAADRILDRPNHLQHVTDLERRAKWRMVHTSLDEGMDRQDWDHLIDNDPEG